MSIRNTRRPRIGIISGSGPEAGIDLWQRILAENRRRLGAEYTGDWDAPEVTIVSVPELGFSMELEDRHDEVWATLRAAAERLAPQVDVFGIACNTLNVFDRQLRDLHLPAVLITPAEAVLEDLERTGVESVALLGSRQTMELDSWSSYRELRERVQVELPSKPDRLHDLIYGVKREGGDSRQLSEQFGAVLDGLSSDVAVLACTELPLIALSKDRQRPQLLDATEVLARSLLDWQHPSASVPKAGDRPAADVAAERPVLLVYAGGTFGMHEPGSGLEPSADIRGDLDLLMERFNDTRQRSLAWTYVVAEPAVDSAEADENTASRLAVLIRGQLETGDYGGVVLIHGTDTMAYNAARIAFELDDLSVPIVCTGSQIPLNAVASDAVRNFDDAVSTAAGGVDRGTWIVFGGRTISALRATKQSSESALGFVGHREPGRNPIGVPTEVLTALRRRKARIPVGVIKVTPGLSPDVLAAAFASHTRGIILECYGAGTAPAFVASLAREATARGTIVLAVTQCEHGTVHLGRYAVGAALAMAGVIDGGDLTTEAAVAKLGILLDAEIPRRDVIAAMTANFAGERQPIEVATPASRH